MARPIADQPLVSSLLDRLLVPEGVRTSPRQRYSLEHARISLARDLENLLNTHQRCVAIPRDLGDLATSIFDYGIPDLTDVDLSSPEEMEGFRAALERIIHRFDPRLRNVQVKIIASDAPEDHTLHFEISAVLVLTAAKEPVVFHSFLEFSSHRFSIGRKYI